MDWPTPIAIISGMPDEKPLPFAAAEALIEFTEADLFPLDTPFEQIVHGTFMRSRDTFKAIYNLLATGFPVQAAMLVRSLFEDMVVAHWLVLNHDDPEWLIGGPVVTATRWLCIRIGSGAKPVVGEWAARSPTRSRCGRGGTRSSRSSAARRSASWWDSCANGDGTGEPLGLRGVAKRLEQAAAGGGLGWIRFAGGQEPLLSRTELVVHKWMTQFLHHTALGLPFGLTEEGEPEVLHDPSDMVLAAAYWMFGQQMYLLHELHGRDMGEFEEIFIGHLVSGFGHLGGSPDQSVQVPEDPRPDGSGTASGA